MESLYETFRMLRAARALLDLSQEQVAELAGVSRKTVVRIESGGKRIAVDVVEKIRSAFEKEGVEFLPPTSERGPAVALRKGKTPNPATGKKPKSID